MDPWGVPRRDSPDNPSVRIGIFRNGYRGASTVALSAELKAVKDEAAKDGF